MEPLSLRCRSGHSGEPDHKRLHGIPFDRAEGLALELQEALRLRGIASRMQFDPDSARWVIHTDLTYELEAQVVLLGLIANRT